MICEVRLSVPYIEKAGFSGICIETCPAEARAPERETAQGLRRRGKDNSGHDLCHPKRSEGWQSPGQSPERDVTPWDPGRSGSAPSSRRQS